MKKYVIYTCLTGIYDDLVDPEVVDPNFDYICFTDNIHRRSSAVWEYKKIPYTNSNKAILSRYVKMMPHMAVQEYEYSIWIDANISIKGREFYDISLNHINNNILVGQVPHVLPPCDCIYEEIATCIKIHRVRYDDGIKQINFLKKTGFPKHYGLFENNILIRKHNDEFIRKISCEWWQLYMHFAKRDQFSLVYLYWKYSFSPTLFFGEGKCARNVEFLSCNKHIVVKHRNIKRFIQNRIDAIRYLLWILTEKLHTLVYIIVYLLWNSYDKNMLK